MAGMMDVDSQSAGEFCLGGDTESSFCEVEYSDKIARLLAIELLLCSRLNRRILLNKGLVH